MLFGWSRKRAVMSEFRWLEGGRIWLAAVFVVGGVLAARQPMSACSEASGNARCGAIPHMGDSHAF